MGFKVNVNQSENKKKIRLQILDVYSQQTTSLDESPLWCNLSFRKSSDKVFCYGTANALGSTILAIKET